MDFLDKAWQKEWIFSPVGKKSVWSVHHGIKPGRWYSDVKDNFKILKGGITMARDKVMNSKMKHYAANAQGVEGLILGEHSDYGNLTSRQCGNFVKIALAKANELV